MVQGLEVLEMPIARILLQCMMAVMLANAACALTPLKVLRSAILDRISTGSARARLTQVPLFNSATAQAAAGLVGLSPKLKSRHVATVTRILTVGLVVSAAFFVYVIGSEILDRTLVNIFGVTRSSKSDAFGPFITLLGLIYSIVLGQIYEYYFTRQGAIQNCLYEEAAAVHLLFDVCSGVETHNARKDRLLKPLIAYTQDLIDSAFNAETSATLENSNPGNRLADMVRLLDEAKQSQGVLLVTNGAVQMASRARALRVSAVNSDLPRVQKLTERLLQSVILIGFVLVDLGSRKLEALLFSVICGCFFVISTFLSDLSDPYSGEWKIGDILYGDLIALVVNLERRCGV